MVKSLNSFALKIWFFLREGGGWEGGGVWGGQEGGRRRGSWKVGGNTLVLEIKIPVSFCGQVGRSRSAGCLCQTSLKVYSLN